MELLKHSLQQLATEHPSLELPLNVRREELLAFYAEEPLKSQLEQALDLLSKEFPQIAYQIQGVIWLGFISEIEILNWLHFLLVSPKLTVDDALGRLKDFYSSSSIEAEVYAFFLGLDAIDFGGQATYRDFVIGKVVENGYVDGRWMPYKCSAMDFFIKTSASLPVRFGSDASTDFPQQHIVQTLILDPLSSELQLLEAEHRSSIQPFALHLRFDPLKVPLARVFGKMIEIGDVGASGRRSGAPITKESINLLWDRYANSSKHLKERLKIPLRWISKSLHMNEPVDAMIAVGTALEVLFLDRDLQDQLTYRISLNGCLWLEDDPVKRSEVQKEIKVAYAARSKSVHGSTDKIEIGAVTKGRELAVRGVLLALRRNALPENWNAWIIEQFPAST